MRTAKPFKPGDTCKRGHLWTPKTLRVREYTNPLGYLCVARECRTCVNMLERDRKRKRPYKRKKPYRVLPPYEARRFPAPDRMYDALWNNWVENYRAMYPGP